MWIIPDRTRETTSKAALRSREITPPVSPYSVSLAMSMAAPVESTGWMTVAGEQAGPLGGGVFDERRDALRATRVDEGPDDRRGIGGVADGQRLDPLHVPRDEPLDQALVDDDPVG